MTLPRSIKLHRCPATISYQRRVFGDRLVEQTRRFNGLRSAAASGLAESARANRIANQLAECCAGAIVVEDHGGGARIVERRCRSRVCVRCSRLRHRELVAKMQAIARTFDAPKLVTLTVRSDADTPLREQLKRLASLLRQLRRSPLWRERVRGGMWGVECTWKPNVGWHPHIHLLIDSEFMPRSSLLHAWEAIVGDHAGLHITAAKSRNAACRYVAQYVSKSSDVDRLPACRVGEWAVAIHGLRLMQTFGSAHGVKVDATAAEDWSYHRELGPVSDLVAWSNAGHRGAAAALHLIETAKSAVDRPSREALTPLLPPQVRARWGIPPPSNRQEPIQWLEVDDRPFMPPPIWLSAASVSSPPAQPHFGG